MWIAPRHLNNVCGAVWPPNTAFQGMRLEVFDTLYTLVQRVYQKCIWFGAGNCFVYFFYFSLSPPWILCHPLQNFRSSSSILFTFTFGLYPFDYYFFYFRINFIIINIFQFHPNIFQSISIKLLIFFQFHPHHFLI